MVHKLVLTEGVLLSVPSLTTGAKRGLRYDELRAANVTNVHNLLSSCATGSET